MSAVELWYIRRGLQLPMSEGEYVEIRVHQQARGPVAVAAVDIAALKHLLGSHLFLAQAQTLLRAAMETPDAKEKIEMLERAFPPPPPMLNRPLASRAARDRTVRETLRTRRKRRT